MSLLRTRELKSFYGDFQALFGLDVEVGRQEVVAIIGANGAGKSTFLKSIVGLLPNEPDAIEFDGRPIGDMPAHRIVHEGIALVPEGRRLFPSLNVEENLLMGRYAERSGDWNLNTVYQLFPVLRERRRQPATTLSGGQQQMVAIGRALMSNPRLLLCDELSLGLAPVVVKDIYGNLPRIVAAGASVVIVEQDVALALKMADRVYCFLEGRISLAGRAAEVTREQVSSAYFGV